MSAAPHPNLARFISTAAPAFLAPGIANAHTFGTVYNLPVPFSMYAYGAAAALVISFVIVAYFAGVPMASAIARRDAPPARRGAIGQIGRGLLAAAGVFSATARHTSCAPHHCAA